MALSVSEEEVRELYEAFLSCETAEEVESLLYDLCTKREVEEMAQRLVVARMLNEGYPYTYIQEQTGASATTIARVSRFLKDGAGGYNRILKED